MNEKEKKFLMGLVGGDKPSELFVIKANWEEISAPEIARGSNPIEIENGILRVECRSSSFANLVSANRNQILRAVKRFLPDSEIKGIRTTTAYS